MERKRIENCLVSDLENMVSELKLGCLTEEMIYHYFRLFMQDAKVDSYLTVNVLEHFGSLGKEEARIIKVDEGW